MTISALGARIARRATTLQELNAHQGCESTSRADVIDLSGEQPEGSTADSLRRQTIRAIENHECDHYTRRPGIASLCHAVAQAVGCESDNVVICGSLQEARYVTIRGLTAGKPVYLPTPYPAAYQAALDFGDAKIHRLELHDLPPAAPRGFLLLSNPNPVTGDVLSAEDVTRLANWCVARDLSVIADESVALLRPDAHFTRIASLPQMRERSLTIGSFVDAPGLAAWQVSWVAGAKSLLTPVRDLKQSITICTAAASQYAALSAMSETNHDALADYLGRQEAITSLLARHAIPFQESASAAFVVADVSQLGGSEAVYNACCQTGVLLGNGNRLGNPGTIRIATPSGSLGAAMNALDQAFAGLRSTRP